MDKMELAAGTIGLYGGHSLILVIRLTVLLISLEG